MSNPHESPYPEGDPRPWWARDLASRLDQAVERLANIERTVATLQGRLVAMAGSGALLGGVAVALIIRAIGG